MEIRRLNKKALQDFIDSEEFNTMPFIPITRHRALSHLSNPRAADDDILLLLAWDNKKLVGCLGILPDFLYDGDKIYKVGWLSASWIDPSERRKGIAGKILREALDACNNQALIADWVPEVNDVYEKSGLFVNFAWREGVQAYLRFNLRETLPLKKTFFGKTILNAADKVLNIFNSARLYCHNVAFGNEYPQFEKLDSIDDESSKFMSKWKDSETFRRLEKELTWILKYPWVLQRSSEYPTPDKRYHFSSVLNEFRQEIIKIRNSHKEMIAFLMLTVRNKSLQVPYLYYQPEHVETVARFIYRYMYEKRIKGVVLYEPRLSEYILKSKMPFISKQKAKIPYIIPKRFAEKLTDNKRIIQDGDGERVFT
jgi:GNAT superfamily N-acetyltransferase